MHSFQLLSRCSFSTLRPSASQLLSSSTRQLFRPPALRTLTFSVLRPQIPRVSSPIASAVQSLSSKPPVAIRSLRSMSSASPAEELVYISKFENHAKMISLASVAQLGLCAMMGGLISFHPAAATSALMPGYSTEARLMLGAGITGFAFTIVMGAKGFLEKQILRVALLPNDPDNIKIWTLVFPTGSKEHIVPKKDFYAITAAYEEFDIDKEMNAAGAQVLPCYVGGSVMGTLMIDMRGDFLNKAEMKHLLSYVEPEEFKSPKP